MGRVPLRYLIAISQIDAALTYCVLSGCSISAAAIAESCGAFSRPERDVRIEQQFHGSSPWSELASKSAAIDSSPALNASTLVVMFNPASN